MQKNGLWLGMLGVVAGALVASTTGWGQTAATAAPPAGCAQWELLLAAPPPMGAGTAMRLPEYGKPVVEKAPAGGWEPFAYSPSGQLVYRRCAPR